MGGGDVPIASGSAKFPVIVFAHGFQIPWDRYNYIYQTMVPKGYIVAYPDTENSLLSPSHGDFGRDIAFIVDTLFADNATPGTFFYNRVAASSAALGHSMGGGAAFLSTGFSANITSVVSLAPAETNPSAITASGNFSGPLLIFSGGKDNVAPASSNQIPMYNASPGACKYLVTIREGSHCRFAESSTRCATAEVFVCFLCSFLDGAVHRGLVIDLAAPWLDYHLKGNASAGAEYLSILASETQNGRISHVGACP